MRPWNPSTLPVLLVAAFLLSLALATWFEGKGLWTAYNLVGAALALALAAGLQWTGLRLPPAAAAICFLTAMLHYVGGSLGGHFGIEGVNGVYAVIPWWDRVTHFAGAAGVAALAHHVVLGAARDRGWVLGPGLVAHVAFTTALAVGVAVELFEFGAWTFFGTIDQGFYSNTMMDLYDDVTGAAFGAGAAAAAAGRAPARRRAASPNEA